MIVSGDSLTGHEKLLLALGDVIDVDDLRDLVALRTRQAEVGILDRQRLQKILAVEQASAAAAEAIVHAKS